MLKKHVHLVFYLNTTYINLYYKLSIVWKKWKNKIQFINRLKHEPIYTELRELFYIEQFLNVSVLYHYQTLLGNDQI